MPEMTPQQERTETVLKGLFAQWRDRSSFYGQVLYGTALTKQSDGWKNILTFFLPLQRDEERPKDVANYGDFVVAQGLVSLDEASAILERVVVKSSLELPDLPALPISGTLDPTSSVRFWGSYHRQFPLDHAYTAYHFSIGDSHRTTPPGFPVWTASLPLYPNAIEAIKQRLGVNFGQNANNNSELIAVVPDYRARIESVTLSTAGINATIETATIEIERQVLLKCHCTTVKDHHQSVDATIAEGQATIAADAYPRSALLILVDKKTGERIDERYVDEPRATTEGLIKDPLTAEGLINLINGGETNELELKGSLPAKTNALAIAVCAFANTRGGRILLGVNDDASIIGCSVPGIKDTVTKIIHDNCDSPQPIHDISIVSVNDHPVVIITVPQGTDRPYTVKNKGAYIRAGATNRPAVHHELLRMQADNNLPLSEIPDL